MNSTGKVALVTGAGSGIGKHSSLALLNDGYSVVLAGRRLEPLLETIEEAGDAKTNAIAIPTDVGDHQAVKNLFRNLFIFWKTRRAFQQRWLGSTGRTNRGFDI